MRFDVNVDEDAAHAAREALVERFGRWLEKHPEREPAEPWDADLLLSWKLADGDGDFGRWARADVDEVLLEHLPRKLTASPDEAASIPASLAAFAGFLDDEGLLDERSDPAHAVAARALAQQRAFLDAMGDAANFGMAKRLLGSRPFDDLDLAGEAELDPETLGGAIAMFNELPFEERGAILGLGDPGEPEEHDDLDLPSLPLRELLPVEDLAALADDVPLLRKVDALHAALGPEGAKLTKAGNLTLADGRRLVAATGVTDRVEGVRSTADMPQLFAVGQVAQAAGAVRIKGDRLQPIKRWSIQPAGTRWERVVDAAIGQGAATLAFGATVPMAGQLAELADQMTLQLLAALWIADEPVPVESFAEVMEEAATAMGRFGGGPSGGFPRGRQFFARDEASICRARIADVLATLTDAGVVTVLPGGSGGSGGPGGSGGSGGRSGSGSDDPEAQVAFTPAGPRLAAASLAEVGFGILLPEEVAGLDAADLIDRLFDMGTDDAELAARLWASGRSGGSPARELVAEIEARPEPARVLVAFSLLENLGDDAVDAMRSLLDGPLAGHAWLFLADQGAVDDEEPPAGLLAQTGIDVFIATADLGSPADVVEMLLANIPEAEHRDFVDTLAGADHPRTGDVLDMLARHHPDEATATYARKAALRWRTHMSTRRDRDDTT